MKMLSEENAKIITASWDQQIHAHSIMYGENTSILYPLIPEGEG